MSQERQIVWPAGTRHKDRDAIQQKVDHLLGFIGAHDSVSGELIDLVELCLAAGKRRVPSYVWTRT